MEGVLFYLPGIILMLAGRKRLRESVTAAGIDYYQRRAIRGAIAPDERDVDYWHPLH
jgi:hypothetical protein